MLNTKVLPSLSEDGWVTNPDKIADYLMSHFFVSDYSQTNMYTGHISSLPWILQETQGDIANTTRMITDTLTVYFKRYFEDTTIEVSEVPNNESPSKAQLSIYIQFTDIEGKKHNISKLLLYSDTIIDKIVNISNG